jgi:hypothetical protein
MRLYAEKKQDPNRAISVLKREPGPPRQKHYS